VKQPTDGEQERPPERKRAVEGELQTPGGQYELKTEFQNGQYFETNQY
jgi:hypothetical protein